MGAVGEYVGDAVGALVSPTAVGKRVGAAVGKLVGYSVGAEVGPTVGVPVGLTVGALVGLDVGLSVGETVGVAVDGGASCQMLPSRAGATASWVPSTDMVMEAQTLVLPMLVSSVQVAPVSVDIQMLPLCTVTANLVPSAELVIKLYDLGLKLVT